MERLQTPTLWVTLFGLLLIATPGLPLLADNKAKLLVVGNNREIYPPMTDDVSVEETTLAFEKRLRELKEKNPDALLVESGRFVSIANNLETAYNLPPAVIHRELGFDAVNLSASDAALSTVVRIGYHNAPAEAFDPLITSFYTSHPEPLKDLKTSVTATDDDGTSVSFISFADEDAMSGLSGKTVDLKQAEGLQSQDTLLRRLSNRDTMIVALSEMDDQSFNKLLGENGLRPDVVLHSDIGPLENAEKKSGSWYIRGPRTGEIVEIEIERDGDAVSKPSIKRHQAIDRDDLLTLLKTPAPMLGKRIPNVNRVVESFFNWEADNIYYDVVPADDMFEGKTTTEEMYIYHVESTEHGDKRLYRVMSQMPDYQQEGRYASGFPFIDMIAVIDEKGNLERVLNRTNFPIGMTATSLREELNNLPKRPIEEWKSIPSGVGGIEQLYHWTVKDLLTVMEIEEELFGKGGVMADN